MKISLFDTLSQTKKSVEGPIVRAYFCGPTVYDVPHLGHARAYVVFDILVRLLRYLNYRVIYVRNVTDVDDKIINRANSEKVSPFEIAERYYRAFYEAMKKLKVESPNIEPRASGHIPEIINLIQMLIEKGYAYVAKDGVYFRVRKFKGYGKLSKRDIAELIRGARIEPSPYKEDPLDFALWKMAKPNEPAWNSPWGKGRPGWHIECSAMVLKHLGETIDIHGGGEDLIFPHHENEIAQSEAATGKPFAKIWFHVGLLRVGKEKMAKSLGNFISVEDALKKYDPETIRLFLISVHYRRQLIFEWEKLDEAERLLDRLYKVIFMVEYQDAISPSNENSEEDGFDENSEFISVLEQLKQEFIAALADDLNTTEAIQILRNIADTISKSISKVSRQVLLKAVKTLRELGGILGILEYNLDDLIMQRKKRGKSIVHFVPPNYMPEGLRAVKKIIQILIDVRRELRVRKIYDLADNIREKLRELGITLEDIRDKTRFYISDLSRLVS